MKDERMDQDYGPGEAPADEYRGTVRSTFPEKPAPGNYGSGKAGKLPATNQYVPGDDPAEEEPDCGDPTCQAHNRPWVIRVTIANVSGPQIADFAQGQGFAGTAFESLGFGPWGVERGVTVEFGGVTGARIRPFIVRALRAFGEESAYVTLDGSSALLMDQQGNMEVL